MFGSKETKDNYLPETQVHDHKATGVLILTADKTEDLEFFYPFYRFIEAGYRVDVVTPSGGSFKAKNDLGLQETMKLSEVDADDYAMLYIPGGKAPAKLKDEEMAIHLVQAFVKAKKPVAAICHGPQLLAAADVIRGKRISAWPDVRTEVEEAQATYVDSEALQDGLFITARWPGDLHAFMKAVLTVLSEVAKKPTAFSSAA